MTIDAWTENERAAAAQAGKVAVLNLIHSMRQSLPFFVTEPELDQGVELHPDIVRAISNACIDAALAKRNATPAPDPGRPVQAVIARIIAARM